MADSAAWIAAGERALFREPRFVEGYRSNQQDAFERLVDDDVIGSGVRRLLVGRDEWEGTASELIEALTLQAEPVERHASLWPRGANALSARLRRLAVALRKVGVVVAFGRYGHERKRIIRLSRMPETASASSASSAETVATV